MPKGIAVKLQGRINAARKGDTEHVKQLRHVVKFLFPKKIFAPIKQTGRATWTPMLLAACAFLWMANADKNLTDSFSFVQPILFRIFTTLTTLGGSYQGFTNQLARYHNQLMAVILPHFRDLTKSAFEKSWLVAGYLLLAVDGSRFQLAWTESLKKAFSPKKKKKETKKQYAKRMKKYKTKEAAKAAEKKAESPQLWLTLLWHVGTGLPYNWRLGASDSSEREHCVSMLVEMPDGALIVGDAGFIGYEFWSSILDAEKNFIVRVGGNVTLLRKLGWSVKERKDTVYLWPKGHRDRSPLMLRLIRIHDGKSPLCLVTNLDEKELSEEQALTIYRSRWGIEVFFRTLKQTFERRKLRSTGATNAPLELEWSLVTLWGALLIGESCVRKTGVDVSRMSPAKVLKTFQSAITHYRVELESGELGLRDLLQTSLMDDYERCCAKTNPEYPRKSQKKKLHEPIIETASKSTVKQANRLKSSNAVA